MNNAKFCTVQTACTVPGNTKKKLLMSLRLDPNDEIFNELYNVRVIHKQR